MQKKRADNIKKTHLLRYATCLVLGWCFVMALPAFADQQLITDNNQRQFYSLRSTVTTSGPQYSFRITTDEINVDRVFPLKSPSRIVIDVKDGRPLSRLSQLQLMGNAFIKNIRIGKYQDKTRYVLDLKTRVVPTFEWSQTKDSFNLVLTSNITAVREPDVIETARARMRPQSLPASVVMKPRTTKRISPKVRNKKRVYTGANTDSEITLALLDRGDSLDSVKEQAYQPPLKKIPVTIQKDRQTTIEPTVGNTSRALQPRPKLEAPEHKGQIVSSVNFERSEAGPLLRIGLTQEPAYTLQKTSAREYRLIINNASVVKNNLLLPHFPPQDFEGLTMVMAENLAGKVNVLISVDRGVRLTVARKHSSLEVRVRS